MNITAINNVWLIGDDFLADMYDTYTTMKREARMANRVAPYLLDFYNVSRHTMGFNNGIRSTIARLQNCVVNELNNCKKLRRMIIIIPDEDILKHHNFYDFGASLLCDKTLDWLTTEINDAVEDRKAKM